MQTVTFMGKTMHLVGNAVPKVGEALPDFTLTAADLSLRTKQAFAGKVLVLIAVPSLDTPVCDMEVRRFNQEAAALASNVAIVAVSRDLPFAQARWCAASASKAVETLSDYRSGNFGRALGIYLEELDLLARAVFVVDSAGIVRYAEVVPEVTHEPDYAAALNAIKALA